MNGLTPEQVERYIEIAKTKGLEPFTDKDQELLTAMLTSETGLKAVGKVMAWANLAVTGFMQVDLATEMGRKDAMNLQGRISGYFHGVELLFGLITLPEEEENE